MSFYYINKIECFSIPNDLVFNMQNSSSLLSKLLCLSPQEILGLQKSRTAQETKASRNWREACGMGSSQYGRYIFRTLLPQAC